MQESHVQVMPMEAWLRVIPGRQNLSAVPRPATPGVINYPELTHHSVLRACMQLHLTHAMQSNGSINQT